MKKLILMAAAALLMMTQCRKSEVSPVTPGTVKMTVTVNQGRVSVDEQGIITWTDGDLLWVSGSVDGEEKWLGSLKYQGPVEGEDATKGKFSGEVVGFESGTKCKFFYLGSGNGVAPVRGTNGTVEVSFKYQDGTLESIEKYQLGYGELPISNAEDASNIVDMKSTVALAKFDFDVYSDVVVLQCDGMGDIMQVSPNGKFIGGVYKASGSTLEFTEGDGGVVTLSAVSGGAKADSYRYVMLVPSGEVDVEGGAKEPAFMNFNGATEPQVTFVSGIQANKYYGKTDALKVSGLTAASLYVDLNNEGLSITNLPKFAKFNLGASSPDSYGDYFQWGGVTPVTSTSINVGWSICPGNGENASYSETSFDSWKETYLTDDVLNSEVDVVSVNYGSNWRMPTSVEWQKLRNSTYFVWTPNYNGTGANGYIVYRAKKATEKGVLIPSGGTPSSDYSLSDPHIFLPSGGSRSKQHLDNGHENGRYWSSARVGCGKKEALFMYFRSQNTIVANSTERYYGLSIRPLFK